MYRLKTGSSRYTIAAFLTLILIAPMSQAALAVPPAPVNPVEPDATQPAASYPVSSLRFTIMMSSGKPTDVIVYYPGYAGPRERMQRISEGPFPTVVFSPGAGASGDDYADALKPLAACGFVVAGVGWQYESDREKDVAYMDHGKVIDEIKSRGEDWRSPLYKLPETTNCGAFGHSRGGRTAFMASGVEPRIKAVGAWMPTLDNASAVAQDIPKSLFGGTKDETAPPVNWSTPLYLSCQQPIMYVEAYNGTHGVEAEIHVNITISFFKYHLLNDKTAEPDVYGDAIKKRAESGEFRLRIKSASGEYDSNPNATARQIGQSGRMRAVQGFPAYSALLLLVVIPIAVLWFLKKKGMIWKKTSA
jgi:dienelactone hydrolase